MEVKYKNANSIFKIIALILLSTVLNVIIPVNQMCQAQYILPEKIRIGIYFDKTAANSINIASDSGLLFGYEKENEFFVLHQSSALKSVIVKKVETVETVESNSGTGDKTVSVKSVRVLSGDGKDEIFQFDQSDTYLRVIPIKGDAATPLISINNTQYRGEIEIKRLDESDMTVINYVNLEDYLYGVLPSEMGGLWPIEALKAQAVAARTYAALNMNKYKKFGFNLCPTQASQVYKGYKIEHPNSNKAVDETRGKVLTYKGKPALIFYFSSSGGHTENVANVWGSTDYPYLSGVPDTYEPTEKVSNGLWRVELTPEKIQTYMSERGYDLGEIISVEPIEYSVAGRVVKLKIVGTREQKIFERERTRIIFNGSILSQMYKISTDSDFYIKGEDNKFESLTNASRVKVLSAEGLSNVNNSNRQLSLLGAESNRNISISPKKYTFSGRGWGHGVGMSQWGAKGMSEAGFTYEQILMHYFPGTIVE